MQEPRKSGKRVWSSVKEINTGVSIVLRYTPGAVVIALIAFGTRLWAQWSQLLGVQQFVLTLYAVAAGLTIWSAFVILWPYLTPRVKVSLSGHVTPSSEVVIVVHNLGKEASFSAKAVATIPGIDKSPFQIAWQGKSEKETVIGRGDSANLFVASMDVHIPNEIFKLIAWQLVGAESKPFSSLLWAWNPNEKFPSHLLKVMVRSTDLRGQATQYFLITPKTSVGPLEVRTFPPDTLTDKEQESLCL